MRVQNSLSRRDVLGMAMVVGSLALSGGVRSVKAQAAKRIEQLAPELDKIIASSEPIQELAEGFGGPLGPAEGPVWWQEGGYLLFSDIHNNRRMKYVPGQGVSVDHEPTNRANGLTAISRAGSLPASMTPAGSPAMNLTAASRSSPTASRDGG